MANFIKDNLIIATVLAASALGFIFPSAGTYLYNFNLTSPLIMIVFFCQGTAIMKLRLNNLRTYSKALAWGFFISQILAPVLAFLYVKMFHWQADSLVGFVLITAMAPTLVSGTIISEQAGGNRTVSLILTVVLNLVAVFMIPLNLYWSLGSKVHLDVLPLLTKLLVLVLIPALIGYWLKLKRENFVEKRKVWLKYLPVLCLGLVIFTSISRHIDSMHKLTFFLFLEFSFAALIVHLSLLVVAFYGAKKLILESDVAKSVAICCSQKNIPITVAIWSGFFSHFSLALLPALVFHIVQIYCDGVIAKKWSGVKSDE